MSPVRSRRFAAAATLVLATPLIIAAQLRPAHDGRGTHQQLGYPPCSHAEAGSACPTCGMTTAFAHAVRGRWVLALAAQPFGALLALALLAAVTAGILTVATGRRWVVNTYRIRPDYVAVGAVLLFLVAWAYKMAAVSFAAEARWTA